MKRVIKLFLVLTVLLLASCGDRLTEKVINTYDNGQPETVQLVDRKGVSQHEIRYYKDGTMLMEGDVKDDKWDGEWKAYFPDGKLQSIGYFKDGLRVGESKVYHSNGNLFKEGYYTNGKRTGKWTTYDEQGYVAGVEDLGD
jgi:antitoxin component YwqK of YwqJK toxin-antitoxin module